MHKDGANDVIRDVTSENDENMYISIDTCLNSLDHNATNLRPLHLRGSGPHQGRFHDQDGQLKIWKATHITNKYQVMNSSFELLRS
jgi:hypothetical protein